MTDPPSSIVRPTSLLALACLLACPALAQIPLGSPHDSPIEQKMEIPRAEQSDFDAWATAVTEIDHLLLAKDWRKAEKRTSKLLHTVRSKVFTGGKTLVGQLIMEHAVALQGLGEADEAQWDGCTAEAFWDDVPDQLPRYGETGTALHDAVQRLQQADASRRAQLSDLTNPRNLQPPKRLHGRSPAYPRGLDIDDENAILVVRAAIDTDGTPQCPTVLRWSAYTPLVLETLDAFRTWRFQPATENGRPVTVDYVLTVNLALKTQR